MTNAMSENKVAVSRGRRTMQGGWSLLPPVRLSWFRGGLVYRSFDHSLGAAQVVAQWARWKTGSCELSAWCDDVVRNVAAAHRDPAHSGSDKLTNMRAELGLTLLDAVLLGTSVRLLRGDALDTLVVVVLGGGTLLGLLALCGIITSASVVRLVVSIQSISGCSLASRLAETHRHDCRRGASWDVGVTVVRNLSGDLGCGWPSLTFLEPILGVHRLIILFLFLFLLLLGLGLLLSVLRLVIGAGLLLGLVLAVLGGCFLCL